MNFSPGVIAFCAFVALAIIAAFMLVRRARKAPASAAVVGGNASSSRAASELNPPPPGPAPGAEPGRMEDEPINNPLDYREDGSIRPGDPAYDFMMQVIKEGQVGVARQNPDGTWATEIKKKDKP